MRATKPSQSGGVVALEGTRPVLRAGIDEVFLSDAPGTYLPHLVATISLHYKRASHGLDIWGEHVILAPLDEESPWESAELSEPGELQLDHDAPGDAEFVPPPSGSVGKARFRTHAKQIKAHGLPESSEDPLALQSAEAPSRNRTKPRQSFLQECS